MGHLYRNIKAFLKEPFTTPMSFWQYSIIVGITIIIVIFWLFIMSEIERGVKEV